MPDETTRIEDRTHGHAQRAGQHARGARREWHGRDEPPLGDAQRAAPAGDSVALAPGYPDSYVAVFAPGKQPLGATDRRTIPDATLAVPPGWTDTVQVIGDRLWWLATDPASVQPTPTIPAPAGAPLSCIRCAA